MSSEHRQPLILVEWLRFACALGVVALHYGVTFWHAPSLRAYALLDGVAYRSPLEAVCAQGWIGVELFFVISGVMIAQSTAGISRATFLRRRVERLGPGVWICATVTLLAVGSQLGFAPALANGWLRSMAFVPVLAPIDDSYWTLGVETSFYLLVAIAIGGGGRASLNGLAMLIGGASALFWLSGAIGADPAELAGDRLLQLALLPHGCFFAIGVLIAGAQARGPTLPVVAGIAVATLAALIEIAAHARLSAALTGIATPAAVPAGLFLAGVAALAVAPRVQPWLARRCDAATARWWGCATFPLYLLHQDAGAALLGIFARSGLPVALAIVLTAGVMIVASLAISSRVEPLLRSAVRRVRLSRSRGPAPDTRSTAFPRSG